jgi:hypothetical protein
MEVALEPLHGDWVGAIVVDPLGMIIKWLT